MTPVNASATTPPQPIALKESAVTTAYGRATKEIPLSTR
jgi:hypothetical protein